MSKEFYDRHFDDEHRILRNRLGILDASELELHIARLSFVRVMELEARPLKGKFDIPHFQAIHRYIFQDVFSWAGDFREVTTSRSGSFGFPPPVYLAQSLGALFAKLLSERHLKGLTQDGFADRAGFYLSELNAIHAFREGNGRTQREFIRSLALHAGHRLSWAGLSQAENDEASRISYSTGNTAQLAAIIRQRLG